MDQRTTLATTVHLQVLDEDLPETAHDFKVGRVVTPDEVIRTEPVAALHRSSRITSTRRRSPPSRHWPRAVRGQQPDDNRFPLREPLARARRRTGVGREGEMRRGAGRGAGMAILLVVLLGACVDEEPHADDCLHEECDEILEGEEEQLPVLSRDQRKRYYRAQVDWRECAIAEGMDLPEPPPLGQFVAGREWDVANDISDEDWNRMGGLGEGGVAMACGEPPVPHEFLVGPEALERLYDWHVEVLACLEREGYPVDTTPPPVEDFVESSGRSWAPAREFHRRYGFLEGATWIRVHTRCGNDNHDMWLGATDFEVDRAALEARYEEHLALTACLEEAGFIVLEPPPLEEFIDELGWNWSHADIWGAAYRENDRRALHRFVDQMDQVCPDVY